MQSDDIGLKVKKQMQEGKLVDDDIVLKLLNEKMNEPSCMRGFILDGFPRNAHQAEKLHNYLEKSGKKLDGVMYFGAPDELLVKRIEGRRVHPTSGRVYHTEFNPPKVEGKDDVTGEPLIQRSDDNAVTLFERLKCYHKETTPLIDYYSNLGLLSHIDASKSVDKVQKEINTVIAKKEQNGHPEPLVNGNSG
nr:arginine kinase [Nephromyces sp. MMRI]